MKKIVSIVISVAMLISIFSIGVIAAPSTTYTGTAEIEIKSTYKLNPEDYKITLDLKNSQSGAFDGESDKFTYTLDSISSGATYYDENDPEAFFNIFTAEDFAGTSILVDFTVQFESTGVFGNVEYLVSVDGFSAPLDLGELGGVTGDLGAYLPTTLTDSGLIKGTPAIDPSSVKILSRPIKTDYYDNEKFDATGTVLEFTLSNGESGTFTYNDKNAHMFTFVPSSSGKLSVTDTEVVAIVAGVPVMKTPITVEHKLSAGYVNITTNKYSATNPGYHALVCEGCGKTHDAQPHVVDDNAWTYNNDQSFVSNGTESTKCLDCGTVLTRDTFGTADFNTAFADMHFIKVIFEYINILLRFIGAATY